MKKRLQVLSLILLVTFLSANGQERYQPTWESLKKYECPEWFKDAKFGIFIHWGVYSVPAFANEWYPRNMYLKDSKEYKYHLEKYGDHKKFGYKDFIPMFKAEKFNADEWLDIIKKSGAKYVVPVAEHHDGFAMYKTALSKWNAVEMGPKKDIIGELSEATKKHELIFGLSSHRIEHWWFMNGGMSFDSDVKDSTYYDFYGPAQPDNVGMMTNEFMNDWLLRTTELVDKYKPQLVWFDFWIEQQALEPYRKSFASYYYNKGLEWNQGVVLNYKKNAYPKEAAVFDIERGSSNVTIKQPWQTDTSIGKKSWSYIDGEENKTPNDLIDVLIDIVSKNGNLLLNIGPKADGTISKEQTEVLLKMGEWLSVNGEGIYGSRPWEISGEGPTKGPEGDASFNEEKFKGYQERDIRFTKKGDTLYLYTLDIPKEKVVAKALSKSAGKSIEKIELIGSNEKVKWSQTAKDLIIYPSKKYPTEIAAGYRITFKK
jgi:alpha-L-fucosidase